MRYQVEYLLTVSRVASRRACAAASIDIVIAPLPAERAIGALLKPPPVTAGPRAQPSRLLLAISTAKLLAIVSASAAISQRNCLSSTSPAR